MIAQAVANQSWKYVIRTLNYRSKSNYHNKTEYITKLNHLFHFH